MPTLARCVLRGAHGQGSRLCGLTITARLNPLFRFLPFNQVSQDEHPTAPCLQPFLPSVALLPRSPKPRRLPALLSLPSRGMCTHSSV